MGLCFGFALFNRSRLSGHFLSPSPSPSLSHSLHTFFVPLAAVIHLDACLTETDAQGDLLAQKDIGIVGLLEERLQFLQLLWRECGAIASLSTTTEHVLREKIAR